MIITTARVSAKGDNFSGYVGLRLVHREDGWTYEIQDMPSGPFTFTWRVKSAQKASDKLRDIYRQTVWHLEVITTQPADDD